MKKLLLISIMLISGLANAQEKTVEKTYNSMLNRETKVKFFYEGKKLLGVSFDCQSCENKYKVYLFKTEPLKDKDKMIYSIIDLAPEGGGFTKIEITNDFKHIWFVDSKGEPIDGFDLK